MKFLFKVTILLLTLALSAPLAYAQTPGTGSIDGVDISINPDLPSPGQDVSVSVMSYITDLNSASIVWLVDGKSFAKGIGMRTINIKAPAIGKPTSILAVIMTVEGKEVKKAITIKSGGVEIVWESLGFVPPFYPGKVGFAYQNPLKITAIPHLSENGTVEIDPKTLVYKWTANDKVVQDQSGYGKQTITLQQDLPRQMDVIVEVSTKNGSQKATAVINLLPTDPSISFYEDSAAYGVLYNKALLNRVNLTNQEMSIRAVPFGFNTYSSGNSMTYEWSINNLAQPDLAKNQTITLRSKEGVTGTSNISLEIRNIQNILQGARKAVSVYIGKQTETNSVTF